MGYYKGECLGKKRTKGEGKSDHYEHAKLALASIDYEYNGTLYKPSQSQCDIEHCNYACAIANYCTTKYNWIVDPSASRHFTVVKSDFEAGSYRKFHTPRKVKIADVRANCTWRYQVS